MLKKVLIFSTAYYPFVGGAEVAIKEITNRIGNIEFDLITAKLKKGLPFKEKIGNVTVYRLGVGVPLIDKLILPFEGALFAKHLSRRKQYHAFWCIMVTFASGAAYIFNIFSNIFYKIKIPIVITLQEGDSEKYLKTKWLGLVGLSWRLALRRTSVLTVISNYLGERAKRLGYKREVKLIPNGVDIEKFNIEILNIERLKIREELGLKDQDIGLVTTSRLVMKNGVGDVIRTLPNLPSNIKFVIFGEGYLEESLKSQVASLKLEKRVIFKGYAAHGDLPKYLKACDIFIRPSLSEGMGNSFIEAMAAGLPVIATPVGGIVDFLKDGKTGYFCKPANPKSIVEAVNRVINDPKKNEVIENAHQMVVSKYDWRIIAMQMKQIFDSM